MKVFGVKTAWKKGIRNFDTARLYKNEAELGHVLKSLVRDGDKVLVTTKYWDNGRSSMDRVETIIRESVAKLKVAPNVFVRVLLHHPAPDFVWHVLEKLYQWCVVDFIGVSNHNVEALQRILAIAKIPIHCNQLEVHPLLPQKEFQDIVHFCREAGIGIEGHTVLLRGLYMNDDRLKQIAAVQKMTVAQYLLAFALKWAQTACISSLSEAHISELLSVDIDRVHFDDTLLKDRTECLYPMHDLPNGRFHGDFQSLHHIIRRIRSDLELINSDEFDPKDISDMTMFLPTVNSRMSDLGRQVARLMFKDELYFDDACYSRFHALTKKLRKFCDQRLQTEQRETVARNKGLCCIRRKLNTDGELSESILNPTPMPVDVAPIEHLSPYFHFLKRNVPWEEDREFFRGASSRDKRMDLCKQVVGPDHIAELCESVKCNQHIQHFLLGNNIAFQGHPELAKSMADLMSASEPAIETWYLAGNCINSEALAILTEALVRNTVAKALWLKRNPLGPEGGRSIRRLLENNHVLTVLDLDNTGLLDEGIAHFASVKGSSIKHLYLDANGFTAVGAESLATFISNNRRTLKSLYACINRFGDAGTLAIIRAVQGSRSLKRLSLSSNRITDSITDEMVECLLDCPKLSVLDLGCYKSTFDLGEKPNFITNPTPFLRLIQNHRPLKVLDLIRNAMSPEDAQSVVEAAKQKGDMNVYAATNESRQHFSFEAITVKSEQRRLKQPKRVDHIDSIYRNKM